MFDRQKKLSAVMMLKFVHQYKVSLTALDSVAEDISGLVEERIDTVKATLGEVLLIQFDNEFAEIFQNTYLTKPFNGLHSSFLRTAFYKKHMGMLVSFMNSVQYTLRYMYTVEVVF